MNEANPVEWRRGERVEFLVSKEVYDQLPTIDQLMTILDEAVDEKLVVLPDPRIEFPPSPVGKLIELSREKGCLTIEGEPLDLGIVKDSVFDGPGLVDLDDFLEEVADTPLIVEKK